MNREKGKEIQQRRTLKRDKKRRQQHRSQEEILVMENKRHLKDRRYGLAQRNEETKVRGREKFPDTCVRHQTFF